MAGSVCALVLAAMVHTAPGGILDALHVRAKAEAPLEADQPGYEVNLLDSHSDNLLVMGHVKVPDSFGKVDTAVLAVVGVDGQKISEVEIAPSALTPKTSGYEFYLRREYLKNSTVTIAHNQPETLDVAVVHLGTFEVRNYKLKTEPTPRKFSVVLAEQGLFDEQHREFTPTDKVPLTEGQPFGFRLYVRGGGGSLPVRVEQTLPSPPKTWGSEEAVKNLKISEDGRTATFSDRIPTNELLEPGWTVAEGDPAGDYEFKIFLRDELVKTFVFHVQPPPAPADAK